jgi:F-type H+-transporting ATPase subunit c
MENLPSALTMSIGGIGPAIAIGVIVKTALESIGRNPEAGSQIQTAMILGVAFAEAIAIYSLVIALVLKFV